HEERKEFTFTVMDPGETHCLGCVYLKPLDPEIIIELKAKNLFQDQVSVLYFWLRPDLTNKEFARNFFEKIRKWINAEWDFNLVYYYIRGNSTSEDRQIFTEVGMEEKLRVGKSIFFS
ncbi:MAG: hypothetical protein ACC656_12405, partial [Candidatus Heimdallarchaeota archaeon]